MGKEGRPFKVHDDLTQLRSYVQAGNQKAISNVARDHGVDAFDGEKRTALIWASYFGQVELVKWLLDNGADVNCQDRTGYSPLHFCAQEKEVEIAKILLDHGANPNIKDERGNSPLWTALFEARGDFEIVKLLHTVGADPDFKNIHGRCPNDMAWTIYQKDIEELTK